MPEVKDKVSKVVRNCHTTGMARLQAFVPLWDGKENDLKSMEHSLRNISVYQPRPASQRSRNTDTFFSAPASPAVSTPVLASSSLAPSSLELLIKLGSQKTSQPAPVLPGVLLL